MDSNLSVSDNSEKNDKSQDAAPKNKQPPVENTQDSETSETATEQSSKSNPEIVAKNLDAIKGDQPSKKNAETNDSSVLQLDTSDTFDLYLEKGKGDKSQSQDDNSVKEREVVEENVKVDEIMHLSCVDSVEPCKKSHDFHESKKQDKSKVSKKDKHGESKPSDAKLCKPSATFLWVYNISRSTKATNVKSYLSKYGKVVTAKIVTDGTTYYGYAIMEKTEDVQSCLNHLDNSYFENKKIKLSIKGPDRLKDLKKENKPPKESHEPVIKERSRKTRRPSLTRRVREPSRETSERRKREYENLQEERRRRELESKVEEARKKLEKERILFEKEKLEFLKLQKRLADNERMDLKKQTNILKKEARLLEAGLLKRNRSASLDYERRAPPLELERKHLKQQYSPPQKRTIRYEEKKMHIPPPPPKICKESLDHKMKKRPTYEIEKPKIQRNSSEERGYHHYQYKYPIQEARRKSPERRKEKLEESHFDDDKYKYGGGVSNKKSSESPRYLNSSLSVNYAGKSSSATPWKQMSSSLQHGFGGDSYPEHWKGSSSALPTSSGPRFHPPFSESNFGMSFYHHPEYSRYGYHGPVNGGKY